jgi:hypothetical protein
VLKHDQRLAKIGVFNALTDSDRGHLVIDAVLRDLEMDGGADQGRLGLKLLLMDGILNHTDAKCRGGICKDLDSILERILSVCDRWAFVSTDPWVLNATITTLSGLAGLNNKRAKELLEQIKERHPNLGAREFAGFHLGTLAERWEAEEKAREKTKAHEERLKRAREAKTVTSVPTAKEHRLSPGPKHDELPESSTIAYWIAFGSLGLVLLIVVWAYRKKTRARLAS